MKSKLPLVALFSALFAVPAFAAGQADQITVDAPYVRLAPPGAKATGAFMALRNAGGQDVQLVKAASEVARVTELHNHINDNGVMRMRQVKEIVVPAGGTAQLKPGSYHVMLIDMKAPLKEGDHVVITLGFADGSSKAVHASVQKPMADMPMKDMDHSKMHH